MGRFTFLGKRHYAYGQSRSECLENLREKKKKVKSDFNTKSIKNQYMLNKYFDFWFETFKKDTIKESTYKKNLELYDRHARKDIGENSIKNIKSSDVQKFINSITSKTAREKIYRMFKEVFHYLTEEKEIQTNPMNIVKLRKDNLNDAPVKIKTKTKTISYHDELILLEYCKNNNNFHDVIKFILYTGLRRGEVLGLIWDNVNLERKTIYIDRQFNNDTNKITTPKSNGAYRIIPLMPEAVSILNRLNNLRDQDELVFKNINRMTQNLNNFGKRLGFKVNPHMLRHTFASRCYAAGLDPKLIQDLLGHETLSTTLDTYTHVLYDEKDYIISEYKKFFKSINYIK